MFGLGKFIAPAKEFVSEADRASLETRIIIETLLNADNLTSQQKALLQDAKGMMEAQQDACKEISKKLSAF